MRASERPSNSDQILIYFGQDCNPEFIVDLESSSVQKYAAGPVFRLSQNREFWIDQNGDPVEPDSLKDRKLTRAYLCADRYRLRGY